MRHANHLPLFVPPPAAQQIERLPAAEEARIRRAYRERRVCDRMAAARLFAESGLTALAFRRVVDGQPA